MPRTLDFLHDFSSFYVIFITAVKTVNPSWFDEKLFQEARRIVIAQTQHITYSEFVPVIVGRANLKRHAIDLQTNGYDSRYDMVGGQLNNLALINWTVCLEGADGSTLNVYAAAMGHFFLTLLPDRISITDSFGHSRREEPLGKVHLEETSA